MPITTADAWEDILAEAVAKELNHEDRVWASFFASEETIAVRTRDPRIEQIEDLAKLKCFVIPLEIDQDKSLEDRRGSRVARKLEYDIRIDLGRMVEPDDDDQLKALSRVAQDIHDWFDTYHVLTNFTNDEDPPVPIVVSSWWSLKADRKKVCLYGQLYEDHVWETMIDVVVMGLRT